MGNPSRVMTVPNIHTWNMGLPNSRKQILLHVKTQVNPNPIIIDDFNTQFSPTEKYLKIFDLMS